MSNTGKIIQVIGPVVDVEFGEEGELPKVYDALEVKIDPSADGAKLIVEVHQHLGGNRVRAVAKTMRVRGSSRWSRTDAGGIHTVGSVPVCWSRFSPRTSSLSVLLMHPIITLAR